MNDTTTSAFEEWVILEILGHRRLAGRLTEASIAGGSFLRIDIPAADGQPAITQYYAPSSVYAITPTTEAIARRAAALSRPAPVSRWELAAADTPSTPELYDDEEL
ncbi:hypothetical protein ABZW11_17040 [Nonomuraea sp. NPDC004580]|uniref:hypothetical protein n=1 Tax=Nonomuraea sp. NPDC004580 TaxID=3154552 RepID=UPI0033B21FF2